MANIFETTYTRIEELNREMKGVEKGSPAMEKATAEYNSLMQAIEDLGESACRIWSDYSVARDNGNERLDINEVVWERQVKDLVNCMRENGITEFTFSSGWSSSVDIGWLFVQNGCKLVGMVPVKGRKNVFENKQDELHGYLFEVA